MQVFQILQYLVYSVKYVEEEYLKAPGWIDIINVTIFQIRKCSM